MGNSFDRSEGETLGPRKNVCRGLRTGRKRSYTLSGDLKCGYSVEVLVSGREGEIELVLLQEVW